MTNQSTLIIGERCTCLVTKELNLITVLTEDGGGGLRAWGEETGGTKNVGGIHGSKDKRIPSDCLSASPNLKAVLTSFNSEIINRF